MLFRIALIVALIAGLASAALNFIKVREKISTLQVNLKTETDEKTRAQGAERAAKSDKEKAEQKLKDTETELTSAKDDRDKAVAEAETQKKQAASLAEQLKKTKQDLGDTQAELAAWKALGIMPEQIKELLARLKQAQDDRAELEKKLQRLSYDYAKATNELARYIIGDYVPPEPPNLTGKVLVVDPKWDFVVLNVGKDLGVVEYGQLLVSRNGKLVAKVRVRSVDQDRSIANVMPGWKLSDVMEGDVVVP